MGLQCAWLLMSAVKQGSIHNDSMEPYRDSVQLSRRRKDEPSQSSFSLQAWEISDDASG